MRQLGCGLLFFTLSTSCLVGQTRPSFMDRYFEAKRQAELDRLEREKLELERQRLEMERSMSKEALEIERQRLAQEKASPAAPPAPDPEAVRRAAAELDEAVLAVRRLHPDLSDYLPQMANIANMFTPGNLPETTLEKYLEGLYVIARYASFSPKATAIRDAAPLTNENIVAMSKAGLDAETIVLKIGSSSPQYRLNADDLVELKTANVADSVIRAMIQRQQER